MPGDERQVDHGGVDPRSCPAELERADTAGFAVPRLGGMARPTGVLIVSERYWAFARVDGSLSEGEMPVGDSRAARLPLVRGLVRLWASLAPLFRGRGVARRGERIFLVGALVAPLVLFLLPARVATWSGVALTVALLVWLLRGRTLHLHGAEHRAIAALEERRLVATWAGEARPSRFAARCGTNFAALVVPVTVAAERLWPLPTSALVTPLAVTLVSLALTMELWRLVQSSERRALRALLLPGLALQRLTTREPTLAETRLALLATSSVLRRELAAAA